MGRLRRRGGPSGPAGSSADRLSSKHAEHVREIAKGLRREADTTTNRHLPDRGQEDAYGGVFEGLRAAKLAKQILSDTELHHEQNRPGYMDGLGLPGRIRSLPNEVKLTRENLVGPVVAPGNIDAGPANPIPLSKLPGGILVGKIGRPDIARGAVGDDEIGAVGFDKIIPNTIPNYAGKGYVDDREKSIRNWAKKQFQPRGKK